MTVRPTPSGLTSHTDISRSGKAHSKATGPVPQTPAPMSPYTAESDDNVEISAEARALQGLDQNESVASGALSNDRMQQVSKRVADGHYDRPEVVEAVLKRLLSDL